MMRTRDIIIICVTLLLVSVLLAGSLVAVFWPGEYRYEILELSGYNDKDTPVRINRFTGEIEYLSGIDGPSYGDIPEWKKLPK